MAGPFAQFQNCEATEESLTTVVIKLIERNPNARPRAQAVKKQVQAFLEEIAPLLKQRSGDEGETQEEMDATAVAKVFEEVKVMFRDLPARVESELRDHGVLRKRNRFHPMMIEEVFHMAQFEEGDDPSVPWLLLASVLRDEVPWVAESAFEVYRAVQAGNTESIVRAKRNVQTILRLMRHSKFFHRFGRDDDSFFILRHLPEMIEQFSPLPPIEKKSRRAKSQAQAASNAESETGK